MARQFSGKEHHRYKFCERCLHGFQVALSIEKHFDLCGEHKAVPITMPTEDSKIEFTNWHKTFSVPLVIYAETEAVSLKHDTCRQNPEKNYTLNRETQIPCAIGFCAVDKDDGSDYYSFEGEKCIEEFFQWLRENAKSISERKQKHRRLIISDEERMRMIDQGKRCVICKKNLNNQKVIHHDHFTGEIYRVAHNSCNLKLRTQTFKPIFFHNLSKYDAHHLLKYTEIQLEEKLTVIPCNSETYISFSFFVPVGKSKDDKILYEEFRFLDSFRFLSGSLDTLATTLETKDYIQLSKHFPKHVNILQKKGVFPYSYLDSFVKLSEKSLPHYGDQWINSLSGQIDVSEEDVQHAKKVWNMFGCKNFSDYLMLYLKTDVILLADVFERCRRLFHQVYGLEPCHYYSAPNISWDAMLKTTEVKLDLLSDIDMLLFCERAIRGGLNGIGEKRYMKANNKFLDNFIEEKPSKYGLFLDVVNLYGGTMMKKLPTGGFEWSDISLDEIMQTSDESDVGYFVVVDMNYPSNLHDNHNDFLLAAEKLKVDAEMLSQYQLELGNKTSHIPKLLETFQSKLNYACHYSVLKFYCQQGLQVTRIHKTLKFNQSDFMKCYIEQNTKLRQQPGISTFEKNFFKLLNNSCFGKTMENLRCRYKMVFVENEEKAKFYCNKYNFEKFTIFRENLVGITLSQKEIRWNKPTYLGAAILDLSKLHLYRFHYEEMRPLFDKKAQVMYRDTDSLFYEIETDDIYEDLKQLNYVLDLSDYPKDHHLHSELNKKVPLKLSDELNGDIVMEAVFLKPKAYSVKTLQTVKQSAKGVSKHVKKTLHHDKFKDVLKSRSPLRKLVTSITSDKHALNITESNKIALSAFDDKRYYLSDGIRSYAYGHYKIGQKQKKTPGKNSKVLY